MDRKISYLLGAINPLYFVLDKELIFLDAGRTVIKLYGSTVIDADFENLFEITRPIRKSKLNFAWIKKHLNTIFLLKDKSEEGPSLKGQFVELDNFLLFVGIPYLRKASDLSRYNLLASDYPVYDSSVDFLILNEMDEVNFLELKKTHEKLKTSFLEIETLKKELEVALNDKSHRLDSLSLDMEEFAFSVGHDLKSPIRQTSMFVQILLDRLSKLSVSDDKVEKFSQEIVASCNRALNLIEGLYSLTKVSQKEPVYRTVDVLDVIQSVVDNFASVPETYFDIHVAGDAGSLETDPAVLGIIIFNLVSNSVKFRLPDKAVHIEISAIVVNEDCVISVKDDGMGFDETKVSEAFKMFGRLSNSSASIEGVGVGLRIVSSAVAKLKGQISVKTGINQGSKFSVSLPLSKTEIASVAS